MIVLSPPPRRADRLYGRFRLGGGRVARRVDRFLAPLDARRGIPHPPARRDNAILVDPPCSATGTARRQPDVLSKDANAAVDVAATQSRILDACWAVLKPGGVLVYASCSALRGDAEDVAAAFRERAPKLKTLPIGPADLDDAFHADAFCDDGTLRLWPWHLEGGGCDAHFVARYVKEEG